DYNERVKEIIESQKTGTRKTRKDAVLVNELLVTSDRDFFERLDPGEQKRFFEESYKLFSERYGKQNIAYATVHNDEQTPHMHLGVVPMRDGKLQGKNVFNRQERSEERRVGKEDRIKMTEEQLKNRGDS